MERDGSYREEEQISAPPDIGLAVLAHLAHNLLYSGPKKESVGVSRRPKEHLKYILHFSESSRAS